MATVYTCFVKKQKKPVCFGQTGSETIVAYLLISFAK